MSLTKKPRVAIHSFTRIWHLILFNKGLKRATLGNFLPGQPPQFQQMFSTNSIGSGADSLMKRSIFSVSRRFYSQRFLCKRLLSI